MEKGSDSEIAPVEVECQSPITDPRCSRSCGLQEIGGSRVGDSRRVLGRDGAHSDFPEVTAEDAEDGVKLWREIVNYVYILPHERAEKRKR